MLCENNNRRFEPDNTTFKHSITSSRNADSGIKVHLCLTDACTLRCSFLYLERGVGTYKIGGWALARGSITTTDLIFK